MKTLDERILNPMISYLRNMVGKEMLAFKYAPFADTSASYGSAGITVEDGSFTFTNYIEGADYFGTLEDVALFKLRKAPIEECPSGTNSPLLTVPVRSLITKVSVVNERQLLFENEIKTYEVLLTRGVLFSFNDGTELSFEKGIWFSEAIYVHRGQDLIQSFDPTSVFSEGWSGRFRGECYREMIVFS